MNTSKKLSILLLLLPLSASNLHSWGFHPEQDLKKAASTTTHGIEKAASVTAHGVKDVTKSVASGIQTVYDATTSMYVTYSKVSGFPLGIQNFSIQLMYPSKKTRTVDIITNGVGQTQLLSRVTSSSQSGLAVLGNDTSTTVDLSFTLGVSNGSLAVSTQEHIVTTNYNSSSGNYSSRHHSGYSNYNSTNPKRRNIGSAVIAIKTPPTGQPTHYKVTINGKTTTKTPIARKFYVTVD